MKTVEDNPLLKLFPRHRPKRKLTRRLSFVYLFAWLRNGRVVILREGERFGGKTYLTIARAESDGEIHAPVYWGMKVGDVILLPGGKIAEQSHSCYIKSWSFPQ